MAEGCTPMIEIQRIQPGRPGYLEPETMTPSDVFEVGRECISVSTPDAYICTRVAGHSGLHAAHDMENVQVATWDEVNAQAKTKAD